MKIIISKEQYDNIVINENNDKITIKYDSFKPDEKFQKTYVYINGVSDSDKQTLIKAKEENQETAVMLNNVLTNEQIPINLDELFFTNNKVPFIKKTKYEELLPILKKSTIKLDPYFLKKLNSGYPKFITDLLFKLYPNNIGKNQFIDQEDQCDSDYGLIDVEGTNLPNQKWSILNFFDTNPMVITKLIEWYYQTNPEITSIENFEKWIEDNKNELFIMGDKLKILVNINMSSYLSGAKTENYAIKNLNTQFNVPLNKIKQYCAGSFYDRKGGKDIEIVISDDVSRFGQIKPLKNFKKIGDTFEVKTYQMKNYKRQSELDYIMFSNQNTLLIFKNKDYIITNNSDVVTFKDIYHVTEIS